MKSKNIFRVLALAIILSLLVVAIPASPALAAHDYDIDVDPDEGEIGEYIGIDGNDWPESYQSGETWIYSYVDIYFSSQEADEGDDIDDEVTAYDLVKSGVEVDDNGDFDTTFKVPSRLADGDDDEDVRSGSYYVCVTLEDSDDIKAVAEFTVIAAEMELDPDEGPVGTEVEITGTDFADDEEITIDYDGEEIDIESGDDETDGDGEFICIIIIPESTAEEHTITVTAGDSEAEADFTVEPEIFLTPETAAPGDLVTVTGTGFGRKADVEIEFGGTEVQEYTTDSDGSFEVAITVPAKGPGTYQVEAKDEDNNKATADFTIAAGLVLSQTTGNVGTQVAVNGNGFQPSANITITYAAEPQLVMRTTSDAAGKFTINLTVPKSKGGPHTITATDGLNTVTATFTMETTPPIVPSPLVPEQEAKAESRAYFDWEDVPDDPSGVTYSLQIATDEEFTDIVFEKTDIADSEYTMTKEDEKLQSTEEGAPYYWRVQAVDGASNESGWTAPGSFYVGFTFDVGGWVLYVLMGLAGLILLLVGFLMGRRTAYF